MVRHSIDQRERDRIIEFCNEADSIITEDPGSSNWEKLDRLRQEMNGFLLAGHYEMAENHGYNILLVWSGQKPESLPF